MSNKSETVNGKGRLLESRLVFTEEAKQSWGNIIILLLLNLRYLEAVLDVVARLPDAHRLQHAGVAQLPQHQVVAEPQGQLGDAESKKRRREVVGDGWTTPDLKRKTLRATRRQTEPQQVCWRADAVRTLSALERMHLTKYGSD